MSTTIAAAWLLCGLLLAPSAVQGQQHSPASASTDVSGANASSLAAAASNLESYKIGAGDVLQVAVWREESLSQRVVVRPDGKISLPLIPEVAVAGMTPLQVKELLQKNFAAYIEHPSITVSVLEANSQVVYILGEVQRPGAYPMVHSMDVLQLIASAGGLTPYAKKKTIYLMHDRSGPRTPLDYSKLLKGKNPELNGPLNSGDLVVVP